MTTSNTALAGIRVLDLGRYQAGPRIGLVLARLGAEVIKVEAPGGDESRKNGPFVRGQSAYWVQYNSGKKSLGLNLRTEQGIDVVRRLVKVSDVLIQNFRPGTIATMGLGYDQLKELNPWPRHGQRVGLRAIRPLPRPHRLRPHRAGHQRHDVPHRLSR